MPATLPDPDPAPPQLDYGHAPHPLRRTRIKWAIRLIVAAALLIPVYALIAPRIEHRWEFLDAQRRWRTFSHVPGQYAYYEQWAITRDSSSQTSGSGQESADYRLRQAYNLPKAASQATLFLRARRAPGGPERLVIVEFDTDPAVTAMRPAIGAANVVLTLNWYTGTPGGWFTDPANLTAGAANFPRPTLPAKGDTTFFTGQPDESDPAHFTLPYQIDGAKGVIDAHLLPDGQINLQATTGPLAPH